MDSYTFSPIPTIHGIHVPDRGDYEYMDHLDSTVSGLPEGQSFGLLLLKADPVAFMLGKQEWLTTKAGEDDDPEEEPAPWGAPSGDERLPPWVIPLSAERRARPRAPGRAVAGEPELPPIRQALNGGEDAASA